MQSQNELRYCLCGKEPLLKKTEYGNQWTVKCTCGFPFGFTFFDRRNAITEWNRYIERMFLVQKHKAELKSLQEEEARRKSPDEDERTKLVNLPNSAWLTLDEARILCKTSTAALSKSVNSGELKYKRKDGKKWVQKGKVIVWRRANPPIYDGTRQGIIDILGEAPPSKSLPEKEYQQELQKLPDSTNLTIFEASRLGKISTDTLYRYIRKGNLQTVKKEGLKDQIFLQKGAFLKWAHAYRENLQSK